MTTDPLLLPYRITSVYFYKYTYVRFSTPDFSIPTYLDKTRYDFYPTFVTGLGIPAPMVRTEDIYRMDGSYFMGLNIPGRSFSMTIPVIGSVRDKKDEMYGFFAQDPSIATDTYYDLYLELSTGTRLILHKVVLDSITDDIKGPKQQFLVTSFFSADPWWYNATVRSDTQSVAYVSNPTPLDTSYTVEVRGTAITYPTITITGQSYLFMIENTDTGKVFGPIYLSGSPGEVISIHTSPAALRGVFSDTYVPSNIISHVGNADLDFYLDPGFGDNHIEITGFVVAGTVSVKLEWQDAYVGV